MSGACWGSFVPHYFYVDGSDTFLYVLLCSHVLRLACSDSVQLEGCQLLVLRFDRLSIRVEAHLFGLNRILDQVAPRSLCTSCLKAYHPKCRQSRMPHAIATRMSHVWYHADRHEQWKRVT